MEMTGINTALSAVMATESPASLAGAVSLKMLDKAMDSGESMSSDLIKMMENSVTPHLGGNFDAYV